MKETISTVGLCCRWVGSKQMQLLFTFLSGCPIAIVKRPVTRIYFRNNLAYVDRSMHIFQCSLVNRAIVENTLYTHNYYSTTTYTAK